MPLESDSGAPPVPEDEDRSTMMRVLLVVGIVALLLMVAGLLYIS